MLIRSTFAAPARRRTARSLPNRWERVPIFVGFADLAAFVEAIDPARPVLALPVMERALRGDCPFDRLLVVVCQQVTNEGTVFYCRIAAGTEPAPSESPDGAIGDRLRAFESLWRLIRAYLRSDRRLTVLHATVAPPPGLAFVKGEAGFVAFDAESRRYVRSEGGVTASGPTEATP